MMISCPKGSSLIENTCIPKSSFLRNSSRTQLKQTWLELGGSKQRSRERLCGSWERATSCKIPPLVSPKQQAKHRCLSPMAPTLDKPTMHKNHLKPHCCNPVVAPLTCGTDNQLLIAIFAARGQRLRRVFFCFIFRFVVEEFLRDWAETSNFVLVSNGAHDYRYKHQ